MPQRLPDSYFHTGAFAAVGEELLKGYTCLGCGVRSKTWASFRAHRSECGGRIWATGPEHELTLFHRLTAMVDAELTATSRPPATAVPAVAHAVAALAVAALAVAAVEHERDPFLDAPVAALRLLEKWRKEQEYKEQVRRGCEPAAPVAARGRVGLVAA